MIGIELTLNKAEEIKNRCFEKKYLVGSVGQNIIRLLPPLIITKDDIDEMIEMFDGVLEEFSI